MDVPTFYDQMLQGLSYTTRLTFTVLDNFSSKTVVTTVKNMVVDFELKHREFHDFGDFKRENVQRLDVVISKTGLGQTSFRCRFLERFGDVK